MRTISSLLSIELLAQMTISQAKKYTLTIVLILSTSFNCFSQSQNLEEVVTHFIRTGDEKSLPLIESGFRELGISKDTTTINKLIGFLIEEREVIKNDKAHLFVLDIMLGPLLVANNEYDKGISILNESYNNIKEIRDVEADAIYSISYLLSISHNAKGDYSRALKYGNEMLKLSGKCIAPSAPFTSYLQIAISELGLGNLHSAYRNIQKAYQSPDKDKFSTRLNINSTYIDVLKQLTRVACTKNDINNVIKYYKEAQKIIIDYPDMDLSLYIDDEYILELATILVEATDNPNDIHKFIKEILEIKGAEYALYPDSELSRVDYITLYCRMVAESALEKGRVSVGKAFYDYAHILTKEDSAISTKISDNTNQWYSIYRSKYENDFLFGAQIYAEQVKNAIDTKDITLAKELMTNFLYFYDSATFCIREFHKNPDNNDGIYLLPHNEVSNILNIWQDIASKYTDTFGIYHFNNFIKSYRDLPENLRVFPLYSIEDTELMKLHLLIYQKDYQSFKVRFEQMCNSFKLNEDQVVDIIFRIKESLYRNYDYYSASTFLQEVRRYSFVEQNTYLAEFIERATESVDDWINYNISTAQSLSQDGKYDKAMSLFDDVLDQIYKKSGICTLYLETLNFKAYESLIHQKYTDAKTILEKADSLYLTTKISDISVRYTSLCYLSFCYASLGEFDKSLKSSRDTYQYINSMRNESNDYDYWGELCYTYRNEGEALWNLGEFDKAEIILKKSYELAKEHKIDSLTTEVIIQELMQLYKERIKRTSVENYEEIDRCFKQAYTIALENLDSESFINEFCTDAEIFKPLLLIYSRSGKKNFIHFVNSFVELYETNFAILYRNGKITEAFYTENKDHGFIDLLATSCMQIGLYEEAVDLYQVSIDKCDDPIKRSDRYEMMGIIQQMDIKDYLSSLNYSIKACYELLNSQEPRSEKVFETIHQTHLTMKNTIASSTKYFLEMVYDDAHPHLNYNQNAELIETMLAFLYDLESKYGKDYLNQLNEYFISSSNKHSLATTRSPRPSIVSDEINPLAQCLLEKVLLNISFDNIQGYLTSFDDLMAYLNKTYNVAFEDTKLDLILLISDSLVSNGHYDHSKRLLLSFMGEKKKIDERLANELVCKAWRARDYSFAINVLYTDAALVHPDFKGFNHYKSFWDINNLTDQLLILYRILKTAGDKEAEEYFNILERLIDSNCCGTNGNSIRRDFAADIYNELGCYAKSTDDAIEYFERASKLSDNGFTIKTNLAYTYTLCGQYEKSDSILRPAVEYINNSYLREQSKHLIYKIKLKNSLALNNTKESNYFSRKLLLNAVADFKSNSKTMTSVNLANYWNDNYSDLLTSVATCDGNSNSTAETSYDAALFQKGVLLRSQNYRKNNILQSKDTLLMYLYDRYCVEQRNNSDSTEFYEKSMMYFYSLHPEFMDGEITPLWQDVKNSLGKSDVAIEFATMKDIKDGENYYIALILTNKYEAPKLVRLGKTKTLEELLSSTKLNNGYCTAYDDYTEGTNVLYSLIWGPLEPYIKGYKNIYFSPYEQLNFINIESLQKKENGRRINEEYNIARVSTTGDLPNKSLNINNAVLYGGIDYNVSDKHIRESGLDNIKIDNHLNSYSKLRGYMNNWSYLSNTYDEVTFIKDELESISVTTSQYTGKNGTEDTFKLLSGNNIDVIHLATHGFYFTDEDARKNEYFVNDNRKTISLGNRSGILFAGANIAWSGSSLPNDVEDGILNSDEIMGMNLSETDLLVLSACQSGLGDISNDGTYGIQRSFKIAGANSIIMSLWEVDDEATRIMMSSFYGELAKGKSIRESFNYAVNRVRKTYEERAKTQSRHIPKHQRYDSAYYWTSFVLLD